MYREISCCGCAGSTLKWTAFGSAATLTPPRIITQTTILLIAVIEGLPQRRAQQKNQRRIPVDRDLVGGEARFVIEPLPRRRSLAASSVGPADQHPRPRLRDSVGGAG